MHERRHVWRARNLADGRQHVLRWARHDVMGWLFGWTAIDGGRVASVSYSAAAGNEAILRWRQSKGRYDARRRGLRR